jgi:hypothetical protein
MMNMKSPFVERSMPKPRYKCFTTLICTGPQGYYKPFATRTLVLVSLLLSTLTLIALTEFACRSLPNHAGLGALGNVVNGTLKRDVQYVKRSPKQHAERLESCKSSPISKNTTKQN